MPPVPISSSRSLTSGGKAYSRGALYHLLGNRGYIGEIVHRSTSYRGQHQPIVSKEVWDQVSARLQENNQGKRIGRSHAGASLLTGKFFDSNGIRFTPTAALKNGKRYRYYTSQTVIAGSGKKPSIARFAAEELESLVQSQIRLLLKKPERITAEIEETPLKEAIVYQAKELAKRWPQLQAWEQTEFIRQIVGRVVFGQGAACIEIDRAQLCTQLLGEDREGLTHFRGMVLKIVTTFQVLRCSNETRLISPDRDSCFGGSPTSSLVKAVVRAYRWQDQIVAGEIRTIGQLAQQTGMSETYINRILQCAYLSLKIVDAVLAGKHRLNLTLEEILRGIPLEWREQEALFLAPERIAGEPAPEV
ncbi:MAG: recombinase family protein [Candidatus Acidiferrales bacterium]